MNKHIITLIISMLWLAGCHNEPMDDKPTIAVSIEPLRYFVERIAGDEYNVVSIIPEGASAESYEPSPKNMRDAAGSRLFICIGLLDNERNIIGALKQNSTTQVLELYKSCIVMNDTGHGGDGADPHLWLSPSNGAMMAESVTEALAKLNPQNRNTYQTNNTLLQNDIEILYIMALTLAEQNPGRKAIIYHPALSYLARDCFFEQIAIEKEGKEPSAAHIKSVIETGRKNGIKRVFYQSQLSAGSVKAVADEIGAEPTEFNPLDAEWLTNMKNIITQIYE
ncbi:MAG: zinc ABC transporter substrate-binding protein [Rikenellaceae bacterium]|nr:zinc ABC transporter substrate-binding protein [Rikenellaceae bacterium]